VVRPSGGGWLVGGRVSGEAYRGPGLALSAPVLDLHDELEQRRPLLILLGGDEDPWGALLGRLERARTDPSVGAVVLRIDELPIGTGRAEELREAIAAIRRKKPVLAYLQGGGQREYYLATAASSIAAPPGVTLMVNGISSSSFYVKEGLSRLGVKVEVVQAGAYKSAPEPLTRTGPSEAAREVRTAVLDDVFARQVGAITAARGLPEARVRALIDEGLFTSEAAKTAGLLDEVLWPDELDAWVRRATGHGLWLERRWRPPPLRVAQRWSRPAIVAVVPIEGIIAGGESRFDPVGDQLTGGESVAEQLHRAVEDGRVRAIVLRIDSPGGDGAASDLIWREVVRARRQGKPVVAWMGDLAASGGYLAAVGADAIVAEPSTLTGSIGVFALKPDLSGTLEKLSIRRDADRRGEKAELLSITRPWSAGERRAVEGQVNAFYDRFVDRVAEGRHLPRAEVEPLARGRVWTGREAFERRLVDRLGSFEDAVALARERARLGPDAAVELRRFDPRPGGGLLRVLAQEPPLAPALRTIPTLRAALILAELGPVLALPPTWVEPGDGP
jgi:protease-4